MRITIASVLFTLLLATAALGQLVINKSLYETQRGKTTTQFLYELSSDDVPVEALEVILAIKGENKTFDFSSFVMPESASMHTKSYTLNAGESHPFSGDERLAGVNFVTKLEFMNAFLDVVYSFQIVYDDSVKTVAVGYYDPQSGETDLQTFDDLSISMTEPLPQTYGTSWTETMDFGMMAIHDYTTFDAWGTLKVPGGKSAPTLRMLTETEVTTTLPIPDLNQERRPEGYNFITFEGINASVSVMYDDETGELDYYTVMFATTSEGQTSIRPDKVELPDGFTLSQNYPNPFNPTTTIDFSLPFTADATIRVYDLTGRVVSTIRLPGTTAGAHSVQFDATNLSSGVYLYRLDAGGYSTAKTFTLVK